jgi:hypothetical protein
MSLFPEHEAISNDIRTRPHEADGRQELTGDDVRAYLDASGYAAEAAELMARAQQFPGNYQYTASRHRYAAYIMPGGYWRSGDCTESEERIKALAARHQARHARW